VKTGPNALEFCELVTLDTWLLTSAPYIALWIPALSSVAHTIGRYRFAKIKREATKQKRTVTEKFTVNFDWSAVACRMYGDSRTRVIHLPIASDIDS
jgi:hypothetical protein